VRGRPCDRLRAREGLVAPVDNEIDACESGWSEAALEVVA